MGAFEQKPSFKTFNQSEWYYLPTPPGRERILRNRFNGKQMQEYSVNLCGSTEVIEYYDVFNWRVGSDCLVNSINYQVLDNGNSCTGIHSLLLYTERVKDRLNAYKHLTEEDAINALQCSLDGFHEIYNRFGYVDIEQSMFCVNAHNQLRIWLSEDLASHKPWSAYMSKRNDDIEMVRNIINIIDGKLGRHHTLKTFFSSICENPRFDEAKFITVMYMKQKSILPSDYMKSLCKTYFKTCQSIDNSSSSAVTPLSSAPNCKNSLSRLLLYNEQDDVPEQPSHTSFHPRQSDLCKNVSSEQYNTTGTTNYHLKQTSGMTVTDFFKKTTESNHTSATEKLPSVPMDTVLSNISTPIKLSEIIEVAHQSRKSSVVGVIPRIPLSGKNSEEMSRNSGSSFSSASQSITPKVSSKSSHTQKSSNTQMENNSATPKVSLKRLKKITAEDIKAQLNKIRRTFSICVTSQKKLMFAQNNLRYHAASQLVQPHQNNNIVSYEVITSEECNSQNRGTLMK